MVPRGRMCGSARKLRDTCAVTSGASLFRKEFGYYRLERWKEQGMPEGVPLAELWEEEEDFLRSMAETVGGGRR